MRAADDETLRQFLAARAAGEEQEAERLWSELVENNFDRVRGMVRAYSYHHLSRSEQDEAVQRALVRMLTKMISTFRGSSMGEWVEATRRLAHFACQDVHRARQARVRHERPFYESGGEGFADGGELSDVEVFRALEDGRRELESLEQEAEARAEGRAFLDWAVPRLARRRRAVIELDRQNVPVDEIQRRLGVSADVVYASRSRALKDLTRLRAEWISD